MAHKSKTQRAKATARKQARKEQESREAAAAEVKAAAAEESTEEAAEEKKGLFKKAEKKEPEKAAPAKEPQKKAVAKKKKHGKIVQFFLDVKSEMKRVTWPTRTDVLRWSGVVIFALVFFGVFAAVLDNIIITPALVALTGLGA